MCIIILITGTVDQNQIITTAVISSVVVAVVFLLLGCLLGFASGWFGHKCKITSQENNTGAQTTPGPLYEDLQPQPILQNREKAFELKENVAYGPIT